MKPFQFGEVLAKLLRDRNMSQAQLARASRLCPSTLHSMIQRRVKYPAIDTFISLAQGFGETPWSFLKMILEMAGPSEIYTSLERNEDE